MTNDGQVLKCANLHEFFFERGIPRFISRNYAVNFGFQWKKFEKIQLDSFIGSNISSKRMANALGKLMDKFAPETKILEVGCGAGRFTEVLLHFEGEVFSIDLSSAVEANQANFPISPKHFIAQADIIHPPFQEEFFDFIVCLGVLQHTRKIEDTLQSMHNLLKPGGWLVFDNYGKSLSWNFRTAALVRQFLKRLPPKISFFIVEKIYRFAFPFFELSANRVYRKLLNIIFPIVFFDSEIPELPVEFRYEWGLLDTYDSLTDWYKHRESVNSISKKLRKVNFSHFQVSDVNGTVIGRAQKSISREI